MIDKKLQKSNFKLYVMEDKEWQPIDETKERDVVLNFNIDEPEMSVFEFECKNINEEIIKQLKPSENEYAFMTDDGYKLKGTMTQKYLWTKYYWRKKGKRYKRFMKHSKQVNMIFSGVVVDD